MPRTWLALFLLSFAAMGAGAAPKKCEGVFQRLASYLPAFDRRVVRDWDNQNYESLLPRWSNLTPRKARTQLNRALKNGELDTPEKIFAALDGLQGNPEHGFARQMEVLENQGVRLHWRNYRMPYGLRSEAAGETGRVAPRSPTIRVRKGWPRLRWHLVPIGRHRHLTVRFPERGPRTPEQLVKLAYEYSVMLSFYRVDRVTEKAPLLSLPFGPDRVSYPKRALAELHAVEAHLFETLHRLEQIYPKAALPLKKRDRLWRIHSFQLGWEMMSRVIFPSYSPLGAYRPTFDRYAHYLTEEVHRSDSKYRNRLRLHWAVSRWREVFLTMILVNAWDSLSQIQDSWDKVKKLQEEVDEMKEKYTPEKLNQAMDNYHGDGEGFDLVLDHYNKQIEALEKQAKEEGDPNGKLQSKIDELKESRDFLAY